MPNYIFDPKQVVGNMMPSVYIDRITVSGEDDDLDIELVLSVKDVIGPGGISQWLSAGSLTGGKTLKDFIKIWVVQTTTPEATKLWTQEFVVNPNSTKAIPKPGNGPLLARRGTKFLSLGLNDFDNGESLKKHLREYDKNGRSVVNASLITNTKNQAWVKGVNPHQNSYPPVEQKITSNHLAYFTWAEFDVEALATAYEIPGNPPDLFQGIGMMYGKFNSDVVFQNKKLMSEGYVFYEAELPSGPREGVGETDLIRTDRLWTGTYHYHKSFILPNSGRTPIRYTGYMGGTSHDPNVAQPLLYRQSVKNNKIQDFRTVERINKLELDFSSIENELLSKISKSTKPLFNNGPTAYFTNSWLSRDINDNCRFMFGLNLRKIIRDNTPYSGLFSDENKDWISQALRKARITSMKVYRKRIEGSSELKTNPYYFPADGTYQPIEKLKKFRGGLIPTEELLIQASEKFMGNQLVFQGQGPASVDGLSSARKLNSIADGTKMDVHYFSVTDGSISNKTDGYYQYKIELEIIDSIVDYIIEKRTELDNVLSGVQNSTNSLLEYYEKATQQGAKFVESTQEANYDPQTNRFTQKFIDSDIYPPDNAVSKYLEILQIFVKLNMTTTQLEELEKNMEAYISKETGSPQGILTLIQLYENLLSFMDIAIQVEKDKPVTIPKVESPQNSKGTSQTTFSSSPETSSRRKSYTIEHTFSEYFDANLPTKSGYDFLNTSELNNNSVGLKIIKSGLFVDDIVPKETQKLFKEPNANLNLDGVSNRLGLYQQQITPQYDLNKTDFTYFTPSVIYSGLNSEPLRMIGDEQNPPQNNSNNTFSAVATNNAINASFSEDVIKGNGIKQDLADFLSYNYSLTVVPSPNPSIKVNDPGEIPENPPADTNAEYFNSSNSQFLQNELAYNVFNELVEDGVVSSDDRGGAKLPLGTGQKSIQYYNSNNPAGYYNEFIGNRIQEEVVNSFDNLPNQIKALVQYSDNSFGNTTTSFSTNVIKDNVFSFLGTEPFINPNTAEKAKLMFLTVSQVEYLEEFGETEIDGQKDKSLKNPKWKLLDRVEYNKIKATKNNRIICRIRPWNSGVFDTERNPQNDLPTYDEYFILETDNVDIPDDARYIPPMPQPRLLNESNRTAETRTDGQGSATQPSPPPPISVSTNWYIDEVRAETQFQVQTTDGPAPGSTSGAFTQANANQRSENQSRRATVTAYLVPDNDLPDV